FSSQRRDLLVAEGQRRGVVIAPVNGLDDVLVDVQLAAQGVLQRSGEEELSLGPPYRIEPMRRTALPSNGKPRRAAEVDATLPLSGLRVVAFTTFVAGPVLGKW